MTTPQEEARRLAEKIASEAIIYRSEYATQKFLENRLAPLFESLIADKRRVDWLEKHEAYIDPPTGVTPLRKWCVCLASPRHNGLDYFSGKYLRTAIDSAIEKENNPTSTRED